MKEAQTEDSGQYICETASLDLDEDSKSSRIVFIVVDRPEDEADTTSLILKTNKVQKSEGEPAEQFCTAVTNRATTPENVIIEWFDANGQKITPNSKFEINEYVSSTRPRLVKTSHLVIKTLDGKDFNSYSCQVTHGFSVNTAEFIIHSAASRAIARISEIHRLDMEVGSTRNLSCFTDLNKDQNFTIEWSVTASYRSMSFLVRVKT